MIKKIAFILLLTGICIGCCACQKMPNVNKSDGSTLFSAIETYAYGEIIVDNKTGVMYWLSAKGTLTLLVDETGNPRIFEGR